MPGLKWPLKFLAYFNPLRAKQTVNFSENEISFTLDCLHQSPNGLIDLV